MSEEICAVICTVLSLLCVILSYFAIRTGNAACMAISYAIVVTVMLLSAFVLVSKYM